MTEQEKLDLVFRIAEQVGRRYGIDPPELWGAGWNGVAVAVARIEHKRGDETGFFAVNIRGSILDSLKRRKFDKSLRFFGNLRYP